MSLNVDTFQMALMVGIGAGGALITQYLDIKNVQEKIGKSPFSEVASQIIFYLKNVLVTRH